MAGCTHSAFPQVFPQSLPPGEMPPGRGIYDATPKGIMHGIPQLPFTIDGKPGRPHQLMQLRDRPLHSVASVEADDKAASSIQIFTDQSAAFEALRAAAPKDSVQDRALPSPRVKLGLLYLDLTIWQDINLGGCAWSFDQGTDLSVLTNFNNATTCCGCFLWWGWKILGTQASSFMVALSWPAFGLRDASGSTFGWLLPEIDTGTPSGTTWGGTVDSLVPYGWNDRATSIHLPFATFP